VLGDSRENSRTDLVTVVKSEYEVGPVLPFQDAMRATALTFDGPANPFQCGKHDSGFRRWPLAHDATAALVCGQPTET
jgi:hypothetical protein